MVEMRTPIPVGEAVSKVMEYEKFGNGELVSINESYGRYLSQELVATNNVPPFDKAPYDGFAIRSLIRKKLPLPIQSNLK